MVDRDWRDFQGFGKVWSNNSNFELGVNRLLRFSKGPLKWGISDRNVIAKRHFDYFW